ncbi:hypothetical protein GCM10009780_50500 [Actinomadura alba]
MPKGVFEARETTLKPDPALSTLLACTAAVGAGLLLVAVPMVAETLASSWGESAAAWNACVLFFQLSTMAGFAWSHWSWPGISVGLVIMGAVPVALVVKGAAPGWWLLPISVAGGGWMLPAAGRRLWSRCCGFLGVESPGLLWAAAGAGGVVALISYPVLIEPMAPLTVQLGWWAAGLVFFLVLLVGCGLTVRARRGGLHTDPLIGSRRTSAQEATESPVVAVSWPRRLRWVGLAAVASGLMAAVTTHLSMTVAAIPAIWVVPLAAYLMSLVVAFALAGRVRMMRAWTTPVARFAAVVAVFAPWVLHTDTYWLRPAAGIPAGVGLVLLGGLACHGLLALDRLDAHARGEFPVAVSAGGALGVAVGGLLAPLLFGWDAELTFAVTVLAIVPLVAGATRGALRWRERPWAWWVLSVPLAAWPLLVVWAYKHVGPPWWVPLALIWGVVVASRPWITAVAAVAPAIALVLGQSTMAQTRERGPLGAYETRFNNGWEVLYGGRALLGYQYPSGDTRHEPTAHYGRGGPLAEVFARPAAGGPVAVVGLGVGTVAAYGRPGQQMDFYEADPAVRRITERRFTYLRDSPAWSRVIGGDGRRALAGAADGTYGLIVLDAFGTGTVPRHLLTSQALRTYARKLGPGGVLAIHADNEHLDLVPMLGATARAAGLAAAVAHGQADSRRIETASTWVVAAPTDADLKALTAGTSRWHPIGPGGPVWRDTHTPTAEMLRVR